MKFFARMMLLFRRKKSSTDTVVPLAITKEETPSVQMSSTPGIKCPECGNRIIVSMQQLTNYQTISCGFCGLELEIDEEKSAPSIAALSKLEKTLADAARQQPDAFT